MSLISATLVTNSKRQEHAQKQESETRSRTVQEREDK